MDSRFAEVIDGLKNTHYFVVDNNGIVFGKMVDQTIPGGYERCHVWGKVKVDTGEFLPYYVEDVRISLPTT